MTILSSDVATFDVLHPSTGLVLPVAEPDGAVRGTIYALHGGGLSSAYWDCPFESALSLARLATAAGFRVAYPDRPGHRTNEERWPGGMPADEEARLHVATIGEVLSEGPLFLLGQSAGSMISLCAAATGAIANLAGIEYSGIGLHLDHDREHDGPIMERYWGPMALYPPEVFAPEGRAVTTPIVGEDGTSAFGWWKVFPSVAAKVTVPVRITMVDHELWWGPIPQALAEMSAGLSASPRVETNVEPGAGHNLSIGWAARAYHMGVLAFFERCLRL